MSAKVKKIVILVPILIGVAVCIWGFVSRAGGISIKTNFSQQFGGASQPSTPVTHSITITKGAWSEKIDVRRCDFKVVSVTPPVRRLVMINDDPNRVIPLPAGIASNVDHGKGVESLRYKIDDTEVFASAIVGYQKTY